MAISKALYFAALIPPTEIREEVLRLKLEIKEKFDAAHALKLPAHLTILRPFWLEIKKENDVFHKLHTAASTQTPFPVQLKDFDHFGQRVLYIKVVEHEPVKQVYNNFSGSLKTLFSNASASSIHPHVTLATRDLSRENFGRVWNDFKNRSYMNSFMAKSLILLKHNGKSWDILKEFDFLDEAIIR